MKNQELRNAGLKVTSPRIKILEILQNAQGRHLSAEDVYKTLITSKSDIGLATVYRVLTQFESAGLVIRHNFSGAHSVFELATDDHHDHMVCISTGKITEFYDPIIEKQQVEIAKKFGYDIVDHNLVIFVRPKN